MGSADGQRRDTERLLSRGFLARNSVLNVFGHGIPLLVGLVAIPLVVQALGTDRMGLLALAWAVMGYFSMFDLGIGRAITHLVAEKLGKHEMDNIARPVWTALGLMAALGVVGAVAGFALSPWLAHSALEIPISLRKEALGAFMALAASVPIVIISSALSGILAGVQRFDLLNALRIPLGVSTFLVPAAVVPFSTNLFHVCFALLIARAFFLLAYFLACFRALPVLRSDIGLARAHLRRLLRFGGWMTVSNAVGPLMVYMDRFVIGIYLSATAVAYYAIPFEIVTKLWIFPAAIVSSLFPAFATAKASGLSRAPALFLTGATFVTIALAPIVLTLVVFAKEALTIWLGPDFAENSAGVLQLLAVGVYLNSVAHVPFALIQAFGRPDLTAKLHVLELPFYGVLLAWLLGAVGITGVAVAWLVRVAVDTALLLVIAYRIFPSLASTARRIVILTITPLPVFLVGAVLEPVLMKVIFFCIAIITLALIVYYLVFPRIERQALWGRLRTLLWGSSSR